MDLIERQAAIDALMVAVNDVGVLDGDDIKVVFDNLPSVKHNLQPNLQPTCNQLATDCISRQEAIDILNEYLEEYSGVDENGWHSERWCAMSEAKDAVEALPSAEPEIIYCGDCKYKDDGIDEDGIPFLKCLNGRSYGGTRINDYCSWAERRTDE